MRPRPMNREAVRLVRHVIRGRPVHGHAVKHPGHVFLERARPARAQDGVAFVEDLRLHEEVAECRMQRVRRVALASTTSA